MKEMMILVYKNFKTAVKYVQGFEGKHEHVKRSKRILEMKSFEIKM